MVSFPGHIIVSAGVDRFWLDSWMGDDDLSAPMSPAFLSALEERLRLHSDSLDALLLGAPLPGDPPGELTLFEDATHRRVVRALHRRSEVLVWAYGKSVLTIGRGLTGRWEAGVEVAEEDRNRGIGRFLALAARHLVPEDRPVWAQVSPGNASSLRAFLAAGYLPVGAEVLLTPFGI
ncbi:GNAT family N-acetyltransferase [Winogradskya consettensis]|uniref:GNAT family N-acetyltransferase n=1 Tax=Winogradskya consettensis TaxID=113560 RepID=UPI001FCFB175|nr:GNAT family N-acetyltransferase [Actinoplanes consettensis]